MFLQNLSKVPVKKISKEPLLHITSSQVQNDIIKNITMFIKTSFKDSKKVKRIKNYVLNLKCSFYLYSLIKQNLLISGEKMLMSVKPKG